MCSVRHSSNNTLIMYLILISQKTGEVSSLLKRARQEEKLQRKTFFENFGQHFILTLFPELQDRVPTFTVSLEAL